MRWEVFLISVLKNILEFEQSQMLNFQIRDAHHVLAYHTHIQRSVPQSFVNQAELFLKKKKQANKKPLSFLPL